MDDLKKLLGDRIRDGRLRISLTQQRLAEEAGFSSAQIISQIEMGERDVKAWELFNLAKALRLDVAQLLAKEASEPSAPVLWRKTPEMNRQLIEADFLQHCHEYALVERICKVTTERKLPSKYVNLSTMDFQEANAFGESVRRELALGNRPASCLVGMLEERFGVKIWYKDLGESGSAASTKGSFGLAVLINSTEAPWRRNFSFAHELFHLLTWESIEPSLEVDGEFVDNVEKLANAFASSLILPAEEVSETIERRIKENGLSNIDLIDVAREFDVSTDALLWRMYNLGFMDKDTVYELLEDSDFKEFDRGIRVGEWGKPPEIPERFVRLAFLAYQLGRLARPRLAELLRTSLIDLTDRLLEYGLDDRKDYQTFVRTVRR